LEKFDFLVFVAALESNRGGEKKGKYNWGGDYINVLPAESSGERTGKMENEKHILRREG